MWVDTIEDRERGRILWKKRVPFNESEERGILELRDPSLRDDISEDEEYWFGMRMSREELEKWRVVQKTIKLVKKNYRWEGKREERENRKEGEKTRKRGEEERRDKKKERERGKSKKDEEVLAVMVCV